MPNSVFSIHLEGWEGKLQLCTSISPPVIAILIKQDLPYWSWARVVKNASSSLFFIRLCCICMRIKIMPHVTLFYQLQWPIDAIVNEGHTCNVICLFVSCVCLFAMPIFFLYWLHHMQNPFLCKHLLLEIKRKESFSQHKNFVSLSVAFAYLNRKIIYARNRLP